MRIVMVGINHRTAPLELRERLAMSEQRVAAVLTELRDRFPKAEFVVLSTCNRMECYVARPTHEGPVTEDLVRLLAGESGLEAQQVASVLIQREQDQAVGHLFRVCTGIDSMVLGEPQILGQVKRAYEAGMDANSVGPVLHRIFQQGITAAKHVRAATGIGQGRLSVATVAVDFARQIFEDFFDKTVLSIGSGQIVKTMLAHLVELRPGRLYLTNRTLSAAQQLWERLGPVAGGPQPWEMLDELLVEADVVVTSTGSSEPIVTGERFKPLMRRRRNRPIFLLDIAVPRDVAAEVGTLTNVYLYNIDDLQSVVAENLEQRAGEVQRCEAHLQQAVDACMRQVRHSDIGQLIKQLRQRLHEIGRQEQVRTNRKLAAADDVDGSAQAEKIVAEHTDRLINKILHLPLSQLDHRDEDAPLGFYAAALRRLFDLEDKAAGRDGERSAGKSER